MEGEKFEVFREPATKDNRRIRQVSETGFAMSYKDPGAATCGLMSDGSPLAAHYATSWDTLHQQVNSSLNKCKLEYTKFRGMSAEIENNSSSTRSNIDGSRQSVIPTSGPGGAPATVWNSTCKRDITKNKIENKCLIYTDMVNTNVNNNSNQKSSVARGTPPAPETSPGGEISLRARNASKIGESVTGPQKDDPRLRAQMSSEQPQLAVEQEPQRKTKAASVKHGEGGEGGNETTKKLITVSAQQPRPLGEAAVNAAPPKSSSASAVTRGTSGGATTSASPETSTPRRTTSAIRSTSRTNSTCDDDADPVVTTVRRQSGPSLGITSNNSIPFGIESINGIHLGNASNGSGTHLGIASDNELQTHRPTADSETMPTTGNPPSARDGAPSNTNYCSRCGETITPRDLVILPAASAFMAEDLAFHTLCLRCEGCGDGLTLATVRLTSDGRVYCTVHAPVPPNRAAGGDYGATVDQRQMRSQAKVAADTYNGQIRGPHAGKAAKLDSNSLSIQTALNAPRLIPKPIYSAPPPDVIKSDIIGLRYF